MKQTILFALLGSGFITDPSLLLKLSLTRTNEALTLPLPPGLPFLLSFTLLKKHHTKLKFHRQREKKTLQKSNVLFIKHTRKNIKAAFSFHLTENILAMLFKSVFKLTCYTHPLKLALKAINLKKGVRSFFQETKRKGRKGATRNRTTVRY